VAKSKMSKARRRKIAIWSTVLVLSLSLALPLASYSVHWLGMSASAQEEKAVENPKNKFWNQVREGAPGYSAVKGEGANVLMQPGGENWRQFRESPLLNLVPWVIVGMAVLLLLYHLLHGKNRLDVNQLSGRKVPRWNTFERLVHWVTAFSFIVLSITGISMLLGKKLLIPVLGKYSTNDHHVDLAQLSNCRRFKVVCQRRWPVWQGAPVCRKNEWRRKGVVLDFNDIGCSSMHLGCHPGSAYLSANHHSRP